MKRAQKSSYDEIEKLLGTLQDVPPREQEAARQGRAAFLESVEKLPQPVSPQRFWRLNLRNAFLQLRFRTLTIAVVLVLLFGGGTFTVSASQTALPGENLYPVKIWVENLRMVLAFSDQNKLQLHLEFASERLDEIAELENQGIFDIPEEVTSDFFHHIEEASALLPSDSIYGEEIRGLMTKFDEFEGQEDDLEELEEPGEGEDHSEIDQDEKGKEDENKPGETDDIEATDVPSNDDPSEREDQNDTDQDPESTPEPEEKEDNSSSSQEPEETDEPDDAENDD